MIGEYGTICPQPGPAHLYMTLDHEALDCVKVAVSVRCGAAAYGTLLVTETRIVVGPLAERPFGLYWQLVKPASNMVRRSLLRAIARRAEAGTLS